MAIFKIGGVTVDEIEATGVALGHVLTANGGGGAAWMEAAQAPRMLTGSVGFSGGHATMTVERNSTGYDWICAMENGTTNVVRIQTTAHLSGNGPCFVQMAGDAVYDDLRAAVYSGHEGYSVEIVNPDGSAATSGAFYFVIML